MANRRVLVKRRNAIRNIHKITRTMQMIANARFQAAFKRAVASKPYTEKLSKLVERIEAATDVSIQALGQITELVDSLRRMGRKRRRRDMAQRQAGPHVGLPARRGFRTRSRRSCR